MIFCVRNDEIISSKSMLRCDYLIRYSRKSNSFGGDKNKKERGLLRREGTEKGGASQAVMRMCVRVGGKKVTIHDCGWDFRQTKDTLKCINREKCWYQYYTIPPLSRYCPETTRRIELATSKSYLLSSRHFKFTGRGGGGMFFVDSNQLFYSFGLKSSFCRRKKHDREKSLHLLISSLRQP